MTMKKLITISAVVTMILAVCGVAQAGVVTLEFDANDIFNYATSDDTRLNQQGTARNIWDAGTGRYYKTYNDSTRDGGATAAQDLQSIANILSWDPTSAANPQWRGIIHVQLWLSGGPNIPSWGEKVVQMPYTESLTTSIGADGPGWKANMDDNPWDAENNGVFDAEYGVDGNTDEYGLAHYVTVLGDAKSSYIPANIWSVTGDLYVDENGDGVFNAGDTDLVIGQQYTMWFQASTPWHADKSVNGWWCQDDYGNSAWASHFIEGSIIGTAVPEPATMSLLALGGLAALKRRHRRSV